MYVRLAEEWERTTLSAIALARDRWTVIIQVWGPGVSLQGTLPTAFILGYSGDYRRCRFSIRGVIATERSSHGGNHCILEPRQERDKVLLGGPPSHYGRPWTRLPEASLNRKNTS